MITLILGFVMVASSLGVKFIGLPRQVTENYRRKTAPHSLRIYAVLGLFSYTSTTLYTFAKGDWLTSACAAPGAVVMMVLTWQVYRYPDC